MPRESVAILLLIGASFGVTWTYLASMAVFAAHDVPMVLAWPAYLWWYTGLWLDGLGVRIDLQVWLACIGAGWGSVVGLAALRWLSR